MMGVQPERAAVELQEAGADVTGANCGNGIDNMVEIARLMRAATDGYMLVHSNAGIPAIRKGQIVYSETPDYMAERFKVLADLGINESHVDELTPMAAIDPSCGGNPIPVGEPELRQMFLAAIRGELA